MVISIYIYIIYIIDIYIYIRMYTIPYSSILPKHEPMSHFSWCKISYLSLFMFIPSNWSSQLNNYIHPRKLTNISARKYIENRKYIDSNHWCFQGTFVGFPGSKLWYGEGEATPKGLVLYLRGSMVKRTEVISRDLEMRVSIKPLHSPNAPCMVYLPTFGWF